MNVAPRRTPTLYANNFSIKARTRSISLQQAELHESQRPPSFYLSRLYYNSRLHSFLFYSEQSDETEGPDIIRYPL